MKLNLGLVAVLASLSGVWLGAGSFGSFRPGGSSGLAIKTAAKVNPVITWPKPATVLFGTVLNGTQLNATANVPGTFAYTPAAGTAMNTAGAHTLSVAFTPTDTARFNAVALSVALGVYKGHPIVMWPTPVTVPFGTALSNTQLNATANVAGTFSYTPSAGTVMNTAGPHTLSVAFTPTDTANYNPALFNVSLGVYKGSPVITWPVPPTVAFGTALGAAQLDAKANMPGTFSYTPAAGTVMNTAGAHKLSVAFTPTDTADYKPANFSVALGVYKGSPAITWHAPAPVPFGTVLSAAQLDATANVPGIFSYTPAAGTVMNTVGAHTLSVAFTPTDTADYKPANFSISLAVNRASPGITWLKPAAVAFDTVLTDLQLNATATVPGTFSYTPTAGTSMGTAGNIPLSVVFTPSDAVDYKPVSGRVFLLVHQTIPVVTWAQPAPVVVGTALGSTQLNATANQPGTFSYRPANATVMSAMGTATLTVLFTPSDTSDYQPLSAAVTLTVTDPAPSLLWSRPQPVAAGTALTAAQLNATASVPGTFSYSPALGAVVTQVGTTMLSVVFTPSDTTRFSPAAATVPLNVFDSRLRSRIQHVIVVMQENRTFDSLFNGYPGADSAQSAVTADGRVVTLQPVPLEQGTDVDHSHLAWARAWNNGNMNGFDNPNVVYPAPDFPYSYVPGAETAPLWSIASAFTLGDRTFQSNSGPSFTAHQYMIAGQSGNTDENPSPDGGRHGPPPWGCDSQDGTLVPMVGPNGTDLLGGFPCLDYETMGDLLDAKGLSWSYFAPIVTQWSAYDAIRHIRYGPDWDKNIITPSTQFLADIQNGTLADVTWIVPDGTYSDHASKQATNLGPSWVASIVNSVGESQYWNSTAILTSWDDWGGWYDHVPPPQIDVMGLGLRVPLLVVSPWTRHGYISHQQHEFGSFLKLTEEVFNLPSLNTRDAVSDDLSDCFDFDQSPPPFVPIPAPVPPTFFQNARPSGVPPDND